MKSLHVKLNDALNTLKLGCHFDLQGDSLWCEIDDKNLLLSLAEILQTMNARVCMITAYQKGEAHELVYHFDLDGMMLNVKLHINDKSVPSITPLFKSADWTERELSEIYGIAILNHPNPKRLFLDEAIKEAVLSEYYSLSSAMSGKVSQALWSRVKAEEGSNRG
ncbi:NADH-quinone oxidoreductase subunit C [Sulfurospirillum barnesii]|uniref:NADH:ubiquinone oxidoreductase 27 kD subunit n=1 Tax=Sulfurospirillum barnesii (strain ATCC 700032 / DSM 10660 / SES-3) TaxID=760154 RepID=I3XWN3_SULBS|nr:NADH-quinone oxidoreductase subunit C [Sulfurospirillum barnesii]AFL68357.1 NADH:ubiquinone oxidoreductase 27 kD subunit [Sulfurospirillum barnesii SES-3]